MTKYIFAIVLLLSSVSYSADILVSWIAPTERENGDVLPPEELGGFEVFVKCPDYNYTVQTQELSYEAIGILNVCEIWVSAYDTNGLYSQRVKAEFADGKIPPSAPAWLQIMVY